MREPGLPELATQRAFPSSVSSHSAAWAQLSGRLWVASDYLVHRVAAIQIINSVQGQLLLEELVTTSVDDDDPLDAASQDLEAAANFWVIKDTVSVSGCPSTLKSEATARQ